MSEYKEYLDAEIGITKNTWNWFPCEMVDTLLKYTNGHILTLKPPIKRFPDKPLGTTNIPKECLKFFPPGDPLNADCLAEYWKHNPHRLSVQSMTKRSADKEGAVKLVSVAHIDDIYIARHYYGLIKKLFPGALPYCNTTGARFRAPITFCVDARPVALLMPLDY